MKINILSTFPEFFQAPLQLSILGRAERKQLVQYNIVNLRSYASDKHQSTDQRPFGGGPGMVMMIEPIDKALADLAVKKGQKHKKILLTSAKGKLWRQDLARQHAELEELTIICGHYEGVDERVAEHLVDEEIRIGDYVLSGGEAATLVLVDSLVRLIPGVLGNELSNLDESQRLPGMSGFPQYTQPASYRGWSVPDVLRSGNHQEITQWRLEQKRSLED